VKGGPVRRLTFWIIGALVLALFAPLAGAEPKKRIIPVCRVIHPSDDVIDWKCRRIKASESPERLLGERWLDILRFNRIDRRHLRWGGFIKVPVNLDDIKDFTPLPRFLPQAEKEKKFILIDLSEQFIGAYENGVLIFSAPAASGENEFRTPTGMFRVTAYSRNHRSSIYKIEKTRIPYPMHYGLRFHVSSKGTAYWIHGRDVPGYPASHGCVGLYDEEMQKRYYNFPADPFLENARNLYEWAIGDAPDDGDFHLLKGGPKVMIVGEPPV
jgi:hypothetical protein